MMRKNATYALLSLTGLLISVGIARIHRGKISCEPRQGNGSICKFTIPEFMEPQLS